jgi:hypothetical protein
MIFRTEELVVVLVYAALTFINLIIVQKKLVLVSHRAKQLIVHLTLFEASHKFVIAEVV